MWNKFEIKSVSCCNRIFFYKYFSNHYIFANIFFNHRIFTIFLLTLFLQFFFKILGIFHKFPYKLFAIPQNACTNTNNMYVRKKK